AVNGGQRWSTVVDHRRPPPDHRSTTGQRWLTVSQRSSQRGQAATWHATLAATSACRSHVSLRGNATSANWVSHAHVAATSAADVAEGITTLLHGSKP
ncbi:hypothetical protein Tco_0063752, partial [Tanacetum coccineum]